MNPKMTQAAPIRTEPRHPAPVEPRVFERELLPTAASVGVARDAVRTFCRQYEDLAMPVDVVEQAVLTASELVTNAVAATPLTLSIRLRLSAVPGRLVVTVWDPMPDRPAETPSPWADLAAIDAAPEDQEFGGWGLLIARQGASMYDVTPTDDGGKNVWTALDWSLG